MRLARSRTVAARPLLALVRPRSARAAAAAATARRSLTTAAASDDSSRATLASQGPLELYSALVQTGELRGGDGRQIDALRPLQRLFEDILQDQATKGPPPPPPAPASSGGWFSSAPAEPVLPVRVAASALGVYTHGGVGCGKTMLMNLFAECVEEATTVPVQQVHFAAFMLNIHQRLHSLKQAGHQGDPILAVAEELLGPPTGATIQVTDIADAMVIKNIFEQLFAGGMVVVATSNRPPQDLYLHGLQRESFLPFIDELQDRCEVHDVDEGVDYRLCGSAAENSTYFVGEQQDAAVDQLWERLVKGGEVEPTTLVVQGQGRSVAIPAASLAARVARFTFEDLCDNPLGSADYLAISKAFHTVFITGVPQLNVNTLPQARRLILLIDALYEHRVMVVFSAAKVPTELFDKSDVGGVKDEAFAFDRTVSRLIEMQSEEYLQAQHTTLPAAAATPTAAAAAAAAAAEAADDGGAIQKEETEGEPFLMRFESQKLTDDDIRAIWEKYDTDGSGTLDIDELEHMLVALSEIKNGHGSVPQELLHDTWATLDADGSGDVDYAEFEAYMRSYGLEVTYT